MKASTWKTILQIAISFLTAIATTLGADGRSILMMTVSLI